MAEMAPVDVIKRYYKVVWEERNPEIIPTLFSSTYENHAGSRGVLSGPAGIRANYDNLIGSFSDVDFTLDDIISEGAKVVVRYTMRGTHSGPFQGIQPTGHSVLVPGIGIYLVESGQIQQSWVVRDSLSLLRQIGSGQA